MILRRSNMSPAAHEYPKARTLVQVAQRRGAFPVERCHRATSSSEAVVRVDLAIRNVPMNRAVGSSGAIVDFERSIRACDSIEAFNRSIRPIDLPTDSIPVACA
jgi:hypothetical protein